ncbi:hypothetical protein [Frondihabitans australicus]|uniref:Uncharacterized protein n=1 Tax=Frondihabitans australicus TaxID=386892 RepID=A0A495ILD5_9MICO|nr:hypothetical protein [Frondihabitans australicus]RKR76579.1 hypothetical protein C8E83_3756 [Frondihabitans australicus]
MPMKFPLRYVPCRVPNSTMLHAAAKSDTTLTLCGIKVSETTGVSASSVPYCTTCDRHMNKVTIATE